MKDEENLETEHNFLYPRVALNNNSILKSCHSNGKYIQCLFYVKHSVEINVRFKDSKELKTSFGGKLYIIMAQGSIIQKLYYFI